MDFLVQGKINRSRHTDHPAGHHSIRTNHCPPPPSPHFLQARCPSCCPTNSVKALKATVLCYTIRMKFSFCFSVAISGLTLLADRQEGCSACKILLCVLFQDPTQPDIAAEKKASQTETLISSFTFCFGKKNDCDWYTCCWRSCQVKLLCIHSYVYNVQNS